jgi:hypothetical protein
MTIALPIKETGIFYPHPNEGRPSGIVEPPLGLVRLVDDMSVEKCSGTTCSRGIP